MLHIVNDVFAARCEQYCTFVLCDSLPTFTFFTPQVLLKYGGDPRVSGKYAYPLHSASKYASEDCVKVLCEFDKDLVNLRDKKYGGTPLHWAKTKTVS